MTAWFASALLAGLLLLAAPPMQAATLKMVETWPDGKARFALDLSDALTCELCDGGMTGAVIKHPTQARCRARISRGNGFADLPGQGAHAACLVLAGAPPERGVAGFVAFSSGGRLAAAMLRGRDTVAFQGYWTMQRIRGRHWRGTRDAAAGPVRPERAPVSVPQPAPLALLGAALGALAAIALRLRRRAPRDRAWIAPAT